MQDSLIIDSDVLIDHLRKDKNALSYLTSEIEKESLLFISVISRSEIFAGIRSGEEDTVNSLLVVMTPINVDTAIADKAGEYMRKFGKSHTLNMGDAIIAATAKEMGLKLITKNVKHYPMKDIEVLKPY